MSEEKKIEKIVELMQRDNSVNAPDDAIKWAKNLYLAREPKPSLVRRIVAVLQADLLPNRTVAGERSASATQARQMFFTAGDTGVDLRITGSKKAYEVQGQILGSGFENGSVILHGDAGEYGVRVDQSSMFNLTGIREGTYHLTVRGRNVEVEIENIEL